MPTSERGHTPEGFRRQLLQRLRNQALGEDVPALRLQQRVAFERLLARLPTDGEWVLKGGFALQLRYGLQARPTKDVDLRTELALGAALDRLRQSLLDSPLTDNFSFELGEIAQELQGAPGGSLRVKVQTRVAGDRLIAFDVDLSSGDPLIGLPEILRGSDLLQFAGISPIAFPTYPVVQHLAEKLHAYSLPRAQENTRVKDLVDLTYLATVELVDAASLRASVEATFDRRGTHPIPTRFPEPPQSWAPSFAAIAATVNLPTRDLRQGYQHVARFWNPILSGTTTYEIWSPANAEWNEHPR